MPSQLSRPPQAALRVTDLWVALKFYSQRLGFKAETAQESKARVTGPVGTPLLLCGPGYTAPGVHHPAPGAWIYLFRPDLAGLSEELSARGLEAGAPVEPYPGFRHLLVEDPDGYVLVFWEPVPLTDEEILAIYRTGPERLQAALAGIDEAGLALRRAPGKWTVRETVHHLVDSDLATFHTLRLALALPGRQIQ
ncbi:MAG TPA: VOC family protein, partial [Symbiobacteriaceae bacterium]|nr:VOC family protein [Symbiobacteriaceae bacterium]